jgi:hypothetical protein
MGQEGAVVSDVKAVLMDDEALADFLAVAVAEYQLITPEAPLPCFAAMTTPVCSWASRHDPWSAVDNGYEIQIDATDTPDRTTGAVYGFQSADIKKRDRAEPAGEWNMYEIRVQSERLRVWLNGVKINDFTNTDPARSLKDGHIGIQNHGADDEVSFRDIWIEELPAKSSRSSGSGTSQGD